MDQFWRLSLWSQFAVRCMSSSSSSSSRSFFACLLFSCSQRALLMHYLAGWQVLSVSRTSEDAFSHPELLHSIFQCLDAPDTMTTPDMLVMIAYEWLTGRGKRIAAEYYKGVAQR